MTTTKTFINSVIAGEGLIKSLSCIPSSFFSRYYFCLQLRNRSTLNPRIARSQKRPFASSLRSRNLSLSLSPRFTFTFTPLFESSVQRHHITITPRLKKLQTASYSWLRERSITRNYNSFITRELSGQLTSEKRRISVQQRQIRKMTTPSNVDEKVVIRELVPGVSTISIPFLRFGKIKFGGRATVVQLQNGLAVFSPVPHSPSVQAHIKSLGLPVTYLIAPDIEHHISLSSWAAAYPTAKILAPESLPEKRASQNATNKDVTLLDFSTIFSTKAKSSPEGIRVDADFDAAFHHELVDAHPNKELVFVHKASKTLITADLLFNLPATEQYSKSGESAETGIFTRFFTALQNTKGEAIWQRRLIWYAFSKADREGFGRSIKRIDGWEFENIVPCHGDSILGNGKEVFRKVFKWHLEGKN